MKNTTIYGLGALVIIAGAGFLYFKNKKNTSLLETALPSNAGTSTVANTLPTKPPLSSTINPQIRLTALDLNIASLPGSTTLAEIQPLIQQQQIANAQVEVQKQNLADAILARHRSKFPPVSKAVTNQMLSVIGYKEENGKAIKL